MPCDSVATIKTVLAKVGLGEFLKDAKSFVPLKNYLEKEGFTNVSLTVYSPFNQIISLNSSTISVSSWKLNKIFIDSPTRNEANKVRESITKLQGFLAQQKAIKAIKKKFEVSSTQTISNKSVVLTIRL